ncbi:MAG: DUF4062 domain-containing protein [Colwellia sp.]
MPTPKIFVSSTFGDLQDIREGVREFILQKNFEPVTFENNDIAYEPNTLLEDSCYREVENCSMLLLFIKTNYGAHAASPIELNEQTDRLVSVTRNEYVVAKNLGIPIFIFIHQSSFDEYNSYVKQGYNDSFEFNYLTNSHLADFITELFEEKSKRYISSFNSMTEIKVTLEKQWNGLFYKYLEAEKKYFSEFNSKVFINPYKLFFYRRNKGVSQAQLASITGLKTSFIQRIEDVGIKKSCNKIEDFVTVELENAKKIAKALSCNTANIKAGLPDDFLSQYLMYYVRNKGRRSTNNDNEPKSLNIFTTKIVVFDFDGTMTYKSDENEHTTWERIWLELGYDINECAKLHRKYSLSEITHKEWCLKTEDKFKNKKLSQNHLNKIAKDIRLMQGVEDVIDFLEENHIKMYIVSGSIKQVLKLVLGKSLYNKFETIKANDMYFYKNKMLKAINGTKYDFEGKADFITQAIEENGIEPYEALFIGNSLNDEWAHQSGAQTLCINPHMTNPNHPFQWNHSLKTKDFKDILDYINVSSEYDN